jgi:hypothetical protein
MRLDAKTTERLVKICRLFSSDKVGERASAAAMADRLLRSFGADWEDVLAPRAIERVADDSNDVGFALRHAHLLDPWQRKFVRSLRRWRGPLTPKQSAKLAEILAEVKVQERRAA